MLTGAMYSLMLEHVDASKEVVDYLRTKNGTKLRDKAKTAVVPVAGGAGAMVVLAEILRIVAG